MSLIETIVGVAIFSFVAVAALGAALAGAHVASAPVTRDLTLLVARNALVEARAATAYDPAAASAVLAAPPQSWSLGGTSLTSAADDGMLSITATATTTSGGEKIVVRAPVIAEAVPQGAIINAPLP